MAIRTCAPLRMACQLGVFAEAADDDGGAQAGARRHFGEGLVDLDGEFPRGAQDQGACALLVCQPLDEGQHESERLAGARLGSGDEVAAGQAGSIARACTGVGSVKPFFTRLLFN